MSDSTPAGKQNEDIRLYRLADLPQVELFQGINISRSFSRHRHWVFSISVIEQGSRVYHYRGKKHLAHPGDIKVICPGEIHASDPADQQVYSGRSVRLEAEYFNSLTAQITKKGQPPSHFPEALIKDQELYHNVIDLFNLLSGNAPKLEKEYCLMNTLTQLLIKYAPTFYTEATAESLLPIKSVLNYLCNNYSENLSLLDLAGHFGYSPYHLVRQFTREIGIPPHIFQVQVRLDRALEMLAAGNLVAAVAAQTGFYDQSHFTHAFKKKFGVTPNQYRIDSSKHKEIKERPPYHRYSPIKNRL